MQTSAQEMFDVVVVGAGNAALTAALAAKHEGARVVVLEKSPRELRGGNSRFTGGVFRTIYRGIEDLVPIIQHNDDPDTVQVKPYDREDFLRDLQRVAGGRADQELSEVMVDQSYEAIRWMVGLGIPWEFNRAIGTVPIPGSNKVRPPAGVPIRTVHEGIGLVENLFRVVDNADIPVFYEAHALRIVTSPDGRVSGVEVRGPEGIRVIGCRALILASGGFQANPAMRAAYLGADWTLVKVRGTKFDTGEMTQAAMEMGAQAFGEWSGCHATPIDADGPSFGDYRTTDKTNRLSYPYSVMVNLEGERFVDEGEDLTLLTYAKMGTRILKQRGTTCFQIFDQQSIPLLEERYNTATPVEASTIRELGEAIAKRYSALGFRTEAFLKTVEEYNRAVQKGTFNPDALDGKHTVGLHPDKTNWAVRLEEPPFRAYAVTVGVTFTFGGLRINREAQVLDQIDRPMPGLFATGEITGGFFYYNYPGGTGLTRGVVYGRIAGRNAAQLAREK